MKGPIYDYTKQRWTEIDTETDQPIGQFHFRTPDGVAYELNPNDPTEYRNLAE